MRTPDQLSEAQYRLTVNQRDNAWKEIEELKYAHRQTQAALARATWQRDALRNMAQVLADKGEEAAEQGDTKFLSRLPYYLKELLSTEESPHAAD